MSEEIPFHRSGPYSLNDSWKQLPLTRGEMRTATASITSGLSLEEAVSLFNCCVLVSHVGFCDWYISMNEAFIVWFYKI